MKTKRFVALMLAVVVLSLCASAFTACGGSNADDGDWEFVFAGSGVFADGNEYNAVIRGNKDEDQTFVLTIEELPALELGGTWVLVEGKGYKLYFDDSGNSYSYSYYDTDTSTFSLKYTLNLSGGLGSAKINFMFRDEAFASVYDGEGLPPHPPTFTATGYGNLAALTPYYFTLICNEDGTCVSVPARADIDKRNGTYTYDEESNVYSFEFEDQEYTSNYLFTDDDGKQYYRHMYTASVDNTLQYGVGYSELIEYTGTESQPQFNTAVTHTDKTTGEPVTIEYKTTYDEETKTYSLIYETFAKCFLDVYATYTVEE